MDEVTVQTITKGVDTNLALAIRYYSIFSVIHKMGLTDKQIQLLAFTAVRGTITPISARKEFAQMFSSSLPYIEKMKAKLVKLNLLTKQEGKYRVHPIIDLDFSSDLLLKLHFKLPRNGEQ